MNILESRIDYTSEINPGRLAYILSIDSYGVNIEVDELVSKAVLFSKILINIDSLEKHKTDLVKFIKKVNSKKPECSIEIHINGKDKPLTGCGDAKIEYVVKLPLKSTQIIYKERIKPEILISYIQLHSNFLFYVENENDIDEVNMLVKEIGIKKESIFLSPPNNFDSEKYFETILLILKYIKLYGYNFSFSIYNIFWRGFLNGEGRNS